MNLKNRDFLQIMDFTPDEIKYLLRLALEYKIKKQKRIPHREFEEYNIALIFEKSSTRTRCSFEVAAHDLGMGSTYINSNNSHLGVKESIADTARILSGIYDGICYRGYEQKIVDELAEHALVPVWNGLTNEAHPTQILADFMTIKEKFGHLKGVKMVYLGDAHYNIGNSLLVGAAKMGMDFTIAAPKEFYPTPELIAKCQIIAEQTGAKLRFEEDIQKAAVNADVLYTDVWVSMGEPEEFWIPRIKQLAHCQVNQELMALANEDAIFMHCLPAFHNLETTTAREINLKTGIEEMEVTDDVFNGEQSYVYQQAENRMHTIKAVMAATINKEI
ncbi:MAG: ornithine carbamoyltransferase [Clostridiaceae bacterium]|nr:ornithine carbamoyltransferase [Clostridiaceae bacterium]